MKSLSTLVARAFLPLYLAGALQASWQSDVTVWALADEHTIQPPAVTIGVNEAATPGYDAAFDRLAPPSMPHGLDHVLVDGDYRMLTNISDIPSFYGEIAPKNVAVDALYLSTMKLPEHEQYILLTYINDTPAGVYHLRNNQPVDITGADAYRIVPMPTLRIDADAEQLTLMSTFLGDMTLAVYATDALGPAAAYERVGIMSPVDEHTYSFTRQIDKDAEFFIIQVEP